MRHFTSFVLRLVNIWLRLYYSCREYLFLSYLFYYYFIILYCILLDCSPYTYTDKKKWHDSRKPNKTSIDIYFFIWGYSPKWILYFSSTWIRLRQIDPICTWDYDPVPIADMMSVSFGNQSGRSRLGLRIRQPGEFVSCDATVPVVLSPQAGGNNFSNEKRT